MHKPRKTTDAFKKDYTIRAIIPSLNWKGRWMVWPYTWNGERKYARIDLAKLVKIIEWDNDSIGPDAHGSA